MNSPDNADSVPLSTGSGWRPSDVEGVSIARFEQVIGALRTVQDRVAGARAPESELVEAAKKLDEISRFLAEFQVPHSEQVAGHLDVPGRGQSLVPAFHVDRADDDSVSGRVSFSRFYLGGGGAAHGGAIPLVFDEVLGRLANAGGRVRSRTAYLNVNYRVITPLDEELTLEARFDSEVGRKRFLSAELRKADVVLADAEGLFVALRAGQP
ncbi:hotdog domain-containing protein [Rhodococcus opacus]|uniref:hotdog domain-containing protein n=1 Tax=Rhodococcus opacus TaxID=37919 RepID=UPI001C4672C5|nr:hotdog domain-containing protein [Rhodococcus opacus]MBV6756221.1 PaaI family thioesterase [Rhodococcus opacus]